MKIIISPAKSFNLVGGEKLDIKFNDYTYKIIDTIKALSINEIKKSFKVSEKIALETYNYYHNFYDNNCYRAIDLYSGMVFKNINTKNFDFLNEHLMILSALYGPIKPTDYIKPYRLDFLANISVDGKNIREFMKIYFNDAFKNGETIFNLASDEFSSLIDREKFNLIDFDFFKLKNGEKNRHSTLVKKARGKMLSNICDGRFESVDELKNEEFEDFKFILEESTKNKLVYMVK